MHIALLGGPAVAKIEGIIRNNFDNVEISSFSSIQSLISETQLRNMELDRLIILQDGMVFDNSLAYTLTSFNQYLSTHYPSMRIITLTQNEQLRSMLMKVFISPLHVHMDSTHLKPRIVVDIAKEDPSDLRRLYCNNEGLVKSEVETVSLDTGAPVQDTQSEQVSEEQGSQDGASANQPPKKKGLFGFMNKTPKKDKKGKKEPAKREAIGQGINTDVEEIIPDNNKPAEPQMDLGDVTEFMGGTPASGVIDSDDFGDSFGDNNDTGDIEVWNGGNGNNASLWGVGEVNKTTEQPNIVVDIKKDVPPSVSEGTEVLKYKYKPTPMNVVDEKKSNSSILNDLDDFDDVAVEKPSSKSNIVVDMKKNEAPEVSSAPVSVNIDKPVEPKKPVVSTKKVAESVVKVETTPVVNEVKEPAKVDIIKDSSEEPKVLIVDEPVVPVVEETNAIDVNADTEDKKKRLQEISERTTNVKLDTNIGNLGTAQVDIKSSDLDTVDTGLAPDFDNLEDLTKQYEDSKTKVVKEYIPLSTGANKGGFAKIVLVTGDRRSGVTSSALYLAEYYASQGKSTLLVDFDKNRNGMLSYLPLYDILQCQEQVYNGLIHVTNVKSLNSMVYHYTPKGYDCLLALYDAEVADENISTVQKILSTQRIYDVIIIDCPIENLYLTDSVICFSDVLICIPSDYPGMVNTIQALSLASNDDTTMTYLYSNSRYLVTRGNSQSVFNKNMAAVAELFGLAKSDFDWSKIKVLSSTRNLASKVMEI